MTYILTFVIAMVTGGGSGVALTTITQEYSSQSTCVAAKDTNRDVLSGGSKVILATCTAK